MLMPWANLTPFLLILVGFLLFSDTSFLSFLVALTAVSVLVVVGFMDTEAGFTRGGGIPWFLGGVVCNVSEMLLSAWMVKTVPVTTFVVITLSVYFSQIIVVSWHPTHWRKIMVQPAKFLYFRLATSLLWYIYWFLEVFLYSELGVVMTTTLSFAQLSITLGASRLILADHPRKRDIALSIFLVLAAALGYVLR